MTFTCTRTQNADGSKVAAVEFVRDRYELFYAVVLENVGDDMDPEWITTHESMPYGDETSAYKAFKRFVRLYLK